MIALAEVAEQAEVVIGVDTHKDCHVAVAISTLGLVLGTGTFAATAVGYQELLDWARTVGQVKRAGVEGTGSTAQVRVKVDKNGLGHGIVSLLDRWDEEDRHEAQIVGVMVSESVDPGREDPGQVMRPWRKPDEMWWAQVGIDTPTDGPATGDC